MKDHIIGRLNSINPIIVFEHLSFCSSKLIHPVSILLSPNLTFSNQNKNFIFWKMFQFNSWVLCLSFTFSSALSFNHPENEFAKKKQYFHTSTENTMEAKSGKASNVYRWPLIYDGNSVKSAAEIRWWGSCEILLSPNTDKIRESLSDTISPTGN